MADVKLSLLPSDPAPLTTDILPMVDLTNGATKRVLISDLITLLTTSIYPTGTINPFAGKTAPTGFLLCDGSAVARSNTALFNVLNPSVGSFTITIAAPGVLTLNGHGLQTGDQIYLTTTGALPTGLTANTLYYAVRIDANSINLSTSRANAYAGTKITTTGTQSGVHTLFDCPWGLGDGSTTFNVPDLRGRVLAGNDFMGGTAASRLTNQSLNGTYGNRGGVGGEQSHQITTAELASHTHNTLFGDSAASGGTGNMFNAGFTNSHVTSSTGSDTPHNNTQPTAVTNYIIKT